MKFQIDKNVPLPSNVRLYGKYMYPYDQLQVGESFFVAKEQRNLTGSMRKYEARHPGKKFTVRPEGVGSRIWRTA